jgi:hypothetical protein
MARSAPVALDSASKYQTLFNTTNGTWSGAEKLIPIAMPNGTNMWISGLSWSGALSTGSATRSGSNAHNIFSSFLTQGNSVMSSTAATINDITNNRFFSLNSFPITTTAFGRLHPVASIVSRGFLYLTCTYSTTDFTSWTLPAGPMYLLVVNISSINYIYPVITNIIKIPILTTTSNGTIYFGSTLNRFSSDYLYVGGQQNIPATTNYSHYLARIPWIYLYDSSKWQFYQANKWTSATVGDSLQSLITIGAPEISLWQENSLFYLLAKQSAATTAINLYSSSQVAQGYSLVNQVATQTARPAGGWSNGAYIVRHAQLASGKRLGFYSNGIANDTYDIANPLYKRPTFFEF